MFIAKGNQYSFALTSIRLICLFVNTKYGYGIGMPKSYPYFGQVRIYDHKTKDLYVFVFMSDCVFLSPTHC